MSHGQTMPNGWRRRRSRKLALGLVFAMFTTVVASSPTVGAQVDSDTPQCMGQDATIVMEEPGLVNGTDGDDVIVGTSGDDIIRAGAGNDIVCAGRGADTVLGSTGDDVILGENGVDDLIGGPGADEIQGGPGADLLRGGRGADTLDGGAGADELIGGQGLDTVSGGDGNDTARGGVGADQVLGNDGDDTVAGGKSNDVVRGGAGDDRLVGGNGPSDVLIGGSGLDTCVDRGSRTTLQGCDPDFELTVLHINDPHSHLSPDSGDLELPGGETRVSIGGFPSVVAKIDELSEANVDGNVVKVHAGDALSLIHI